MSSAGVSVCGPGLPAQSPQKLEGACQTRVRRRACPSHVPHSTVRQLRFRVPERVMPSRDRVGMWPLCGRGHKNSPPIRVDRGAWNRL